MRRIFIAIALMLATTCVAQSQTQITRNGNNFSKAKTERTATEPKKTEFTWTDSKGNIYPIYVGKTGSCYIVRVSKNTGKEYKQYLGAEVSEQVCEALGIEYKRKSNTESKNTSNQ